jgi:type II restriction/modification system DNA methylase subunit YeeA
MLNAPSFLKKALLNPYYSYTYATDILKHPFPLGEPAISTDASASYYYSRYVLKGPSPLGEPAIAKDPYYQALYKEFLTTC